MTSISDGTFAHCSSLTSITIPESVTSIGEYAFSGCSSLTSVTIPNGVTSISDGTFDGCSSLTSIIIPNSVTSIGDHAFSVSGLESIIIGNSVTIIGIEALARCSWLTDVYCLAECVPETKRGVFSRSNTKTLYVPESSLDLYKKTSPWRSFKEIVGLTQDMIDGIKEIKKEELRMKNEEEWYSLDGKKLSESQKGINIIRHSDGTSKKVLVK